MVKIQAGGQAAVYKYLDLSEDREVAVKIVTYTYRETTEQEIVRDLRILYSLNTLPHIV